ncbi:MAG: hypothetical protein NVSMB65_07790 [Chloroflexota bacterium]
MSQLARHYPQLRAAGAGLAMVSVDSPRRTRQLVEDTAAPFPVLSDGDHDCAVAYNVFENGIAVPATFLIDTAGRVRWSYIGATPSDRPPVALMLSQLARLPGGTVQGESHG